MEPILILAYWPDRVETDGGRRRDLPRLLRRYCRGATRVVVYEARETIAPWSAGSGPEGTSNGHLDGLPLVL
jgi:hypothetical protein